MEKKSKKIVRLVLFSSLLIILTNRGIKLVKGEKKAKQIITNHKISMMHDENVVAHRGFSGLEPDNTYQSVGLALETPCVDIIEIDVRMTNDGKIILHHDSVINMNDLLIHIEDIDLDDIDESCIRSRYPHNSLQNYIYDDTLFLMNRWFSKDEEDKNIIRFSEFVNWYNFSKPLIVDVKTRDVDEYYMDELNRLLSNHKQYVYIQSTNYLFLKNMLIKYPEYKYLFIVDSMNDIGKMDDIFDGYTVRQGLLSNINVKYDKIYLIWTINSRARYINLINNKKYNSNMYIISDHPDYICALSEAKRLKLK